MWRRRYSFDALGFGLALGSVAPLGCDSANSVGGGDADDGEVVSASEFGRKAEADLAEMKAHLGSGEDIKYGCAGNMGKYASLATSDNPADKKAHETLSTLCYVDFPRKLIADLREEMKKDDFSTLATVGLRTMIESDEFPRGAGEPLKVAEEARRLLDVEVPLAALAKQMVLAKSMEDQGMALTVGCANAKRIVDKSGDKLGGDEAGKKAIDEFKATCPDK
jgi:hypothetical protein